MHDPANVTLIIAFLCAVVSVYRPSGWPRARAVRVGDRLRWFIAWESLRASLQRKLAPRSACDRLFGCGRLFCDRCDNGPYS